MSYIEIFVVSKDGDVLSFEETSNNHGFAPLVWDKLKVKYGVSSANPNPFDNESLKKLWDKVGTGEVSRLDDVLLQATFDRVWVKREDVPLLIEACRAFHLEFIAGNNLVTTVDRAADILEKCLKDPEDIGVAFNMCSANEPFWSVAVPEPCPECGCTCQSDGETRPYNVLTDSEQPSGEFAGQKHWALVVPDGS